MSTKIICVVFCCREFTYQINWYIYIFSCILVSYLFACIVSILFFSLQNFQDLVSWKINETFEIIVHIIIILSVSLIPACMFLSLFYLEKNIRWLDLHLPMHLVLVTIKVVIFIPTHGDVHTWFTIMDKLPTRVRLGRI